jgi:hypothetical protein
MRTTLGRIVAGVVRNGRPHTLLGRWGAWQARFRPHRDERFQGPDEPNPRHWRASRPRRLGPLDPAWTRRTIEALPRTWKAVLRGQEIGLGLSTAQQRRIRHQALTAIRDAAAGEDRARS